MTPRPDENADAALFGNRFVTQEVPTSTFPTEGMSAQDAMRLVGEDLALEGDPARNLASFVTTWMEPEAEILIHEAISTNHIDHEEYPLADRIEESVRADAGRPLARA